MQLNKIVMLGMWMCLMTDDCIFVEGIVEIEIKMNALNKHLSTLITVVLAIKLSLT